MVFSRFALVCQLLPQITWIVPVEFYVGVLGKSLGVWHADAVGGASQEATQIWNELPACILVRFKTKTTWRVEGIDEDNVFPVAPQKKPWYLDKGRKRPVLRVTRKQFPLAPGFAATAHAAQGQTCKEGVVMDMHIGDAGDPLTAYIALTRVQDRYGLFVYRPFPAAPFQKGAKVGRELLLRFWGGEKMDWRALRAKYRDERQCKECNEAKPASAFTAGRWKRADAARVCKECIRRHVEAQQPWQCMACTAWKQEDVFKTEHAKPQATFYRICKTCEQTQVCSVCNTRKDEKKFSGGAWKRTRRGGRVCLDCSGKAWGWWRCSVCKVKQAACAFDSWLAQHRSCNGDQVCSKCWQCPISRGSISKAVQRVTATQAKVARRAAEEKKARAIADVWAAIAERKRKREEHSPQRKEAELEAKQRRQENGTEMTTEGLANVRGQQDDSNGRQRAVQATTDVAAASVERKRKTEQDTAQMQEAPPNAKQRREDGGIEKGGDGEAEMSCTQQSKGSAREMSREGKSFQYVCPACQKSVRSSIRTGQVDHRRACGNRFQVWDGQVVAKGYVYICPACKGNVASEVKTGQIDHRTVCGNKFSVRDGVVKEKGYVYICPACKGNVASDVKTGKINHRTVCGNQFSVKDGVVQEKAYVYICPACKGNVASDVKTGRIDHRTVCGNQFSVKDGVVPEKTYVYICPACKGNVASEIKTGQINHRTVCGNQFSVRNGLVKEKAYVYICPVCKGNVASDVKTGRIDHRTVCGSQFSVKDGVVKEKGGKRQAGTPRRSD